MNLKTIASLNSGELKLILYLLNVKKSISLNQVKKYITETNIFILLESLEEKRIIDLTVDSFTHELFIEFEKEKFDMVISDWDEQDILDALTLLFYDEENKEYFIEELLKPHNFWTPLIRRKLKNRLNWNPNIVDIRQELVAYFKQQLRLKNNFELTPEDMKLNFYQATTIQKNYPNLVFMDYKNAIDFFLNDKFWKKVILSITALNKHLPKYLAQQSNFNSSTMKLL